MAEILNAGDLVLCDICNCDGDEGQMGGAIVGESALCQMCFESTTIVDFDDVIVMSPEKSFGDNVREYRKKVYGTSDCISVIGLDDADIKATLQDYLKRKGV